MSRSGTAGLLAWLVLAAGCAPQLVPLAAEAGVDGDDPVAVVEGLAADPATASAFLADGADAPTRWEALLGAELPPELLESVVRTAAERATPDAMLAAAAEGIRRAGPDAAAVLAVVRGLGPALSAVNAGDAGPEGTHEGVTDLVRAVYAAADPDDQELLTAIVAALLDHAVSAAVAAASTPGAGQDRDDYFRPLARQLGVIAGPATLELVDAVGAPGSAPPITEALARLHPAHPDPIPFSLATLVLQRLLDRAGMREALIELGVFVTTAPDDGSRVVPFEGGSLFATETGVETFIFWIRDAFGAELERLLRD